MNWRIGRDARGRTQPILLRRPPAAIRKTDKAAPTNSSRMTEVALSCFDPSGPASVVARLGRRRKLGIEARLSIDSVQVFEIAQRAVKETLDKT
jgi:hypothetical protein